MIFDVIFIGSGPANLFAASEVLSSSDKSILVLERAKRLNDSRNVGNGWLGGSARSHLQLFIEPGVGGNITDEDLINTAIDKIKIFTGSSKLKESRPKILKRTFQYLEDKGITLNEPKVINVTEDKTVKMGDYLYSYIKDKATVLHKMIIESVKKTASGFKITTNDGEFEAKKVVFGLGRGGAHTLINDIDTNFNLSFSGNEFELGVRLEFPSSVMEECLSKTNIFNLKFDDFRTSIPLNLGSVETEEVNHLKISNGRNISSNRGSYSTMNLLKKFKHSKPREEVYRLVEITNVLCDGQLLREPAVKFAKGKSMLSPLSEYEDIRKGMLKLIDAFPDLGKKCAVYAPEAKLNPIQFNLSSSFRSEIEGVYVIGDMSGQTRSFLQAACSGLIAAKDILQN